MPAHTSKQPVYKRVHLVKVCQFHSKFQLGARRKKNFETGQRELPFLFQVIGSSGRAADRHQFYFPPIHQGCLENHKKLQPHPHILHGKKAPFHSKIDGVALKFPHFLT